MAQRRWLVLGLGNRLAGEDGFGGAVVDALRGRSELSGLADVRDAGTDLLAELPTFGTYDEVMLVDVVLGGGRAGEVALVEEPVFTAWPDDSPNCHGVSPVLIVKLFRRLYQGSATRIRLVALHTDALSSVAGVASPAVARGVGTIVDAILGTARAVDPFQTCGSCRLAWDTWDDFAVDPRVRLLGLQAVPGLPAANLLVFEHGCGSSVSVLTKRLRFLLPDDDASAGWRSLRDTEECPRHCRSLADLAACDRPCINARDRELIRIVQGIRPAPDGRRRDRAG